MGTHFLRHRLAAALLLLAFVVPAAAVCGASPRDEAMAGMSCCRKPAASPTGSVERDCCRINERLPENTPASPLPSRVTTSDHATLAPIVVGNIFAGGPDSRAHHAMESARGRPHTPDYLLAAALLI